jgi:hypothetical protein
MRRNARDKECPARWVISSFRNQPKTKTLMRRLLLRRRQVSEIAGVNEVRLLVFVCLLVDVTFFFVISYIESRRMVGAFQGRKLGVKFTELAVEDALLIGQKKLLVGSPVRLRVGGTNALWGTGQGGYMRVGLNRQVGCGYGCIL